MNKVELFKKISDARNAEGTVYDSPVTIPMEDVLGVIPEEFRPELFRFQVPGLNHSMALIRPRGYGRAAILLKKPDICRHPRRTSKSSVYISLVDEGDKESVLMCYSIQCLCGCCWRDLFINFEEDWNNSIKAEKSEVFSEAVSVECSKWGISTILIGLTREGEPATKNPCPGVRWKGLPVDYRLIVSQFSENEGIFIESWD